VHGPREREPTPSWRPIAAAAYARPKGQPQALHAPDPEETRPEFVSAQDLETPLVGHMPKVKRQALSEPDSWNTRARQLARRLQTRSHPSPNGDAMKNMYLSSSVVAIAVLSCGGAGGGSEGEDGVCALDPGSYAVTYKVLSSTCGDLEPNDTEYLTITSTSAVDPQNGAPAPEGCVDSDDAVKGCVASYTRNCSAQIPEGRMQVKASFRFDFGKWTGSLTTEGKLYDPTSGNLLGTCTVVQGMTGTLAPETSVANQALDTGAAVEWLSISGIAEPYFNGIPSSTSL
jgi:hypothetical protein